ncbi:unnamed protein product, partial [Vitis vinifera]|uniref:Amino acid transporter transmembrane domain-containing protein n=2 Tax=Vitis vinifera TaxID=29760 RepID=D7U4U8_VITVI
MADGHYYIKKDLRFIISNKSNSFSMYDNVGAIIVEEDMGEVMVEEYPFVHVVTTVPSPIQEVVPKPQEDWLPVSDSRKEVPSPQEGWLPITESRKGGAFTSAFHLLASGIGIQAFLLPVAFSKLGWFWGIACLLLAFAWQLYTKWLLVQLHEPGPGTRYSRYLHLSVVAFGPKLGKLLALFPVMYLSGGTCVMLINYGGGSMELLFRTVCGDSSCIANKLTGAEWFMVFTCLAIIVAQLPNLNSMAGVSLLGAATAISYCTFLWILSITKGRPAGVSYSPPEAESRMARIGEVLTAIGMIALAFRGHNVVLEIQGTMPSNPKHPSQEPMWRGVIVSCSITAACLFPLAIAGYWAYGNRIPANGGLLSAFSEFHGQNTKKLVMRMIYLLIVVNSLCSYQIYAMPVFDNLEFRYISKKNKPCSRWVRAAIRVFFGGLTTFIAVAVSFLGSLGPLIGGIALPLTLAYPCFMWIAIKKPRQYGAMWYLNLGLGCSGIILSVLLVAAAVWKIVDKGIDASFFNTHLSPLLKPPQS